MWVKRALAEANMKRLLFRANDREENGDGNDNSCAEFTAAH